ncbi:hypothetical protein AVEN_158425-1 [Araneus ventricosus]|uniref:Uncharacterized protein n=1 Tax=Araneus ventricosus TaxID=182803 RepID=A0A4Y2J2L9_ARAVE|nr:hypothetical protein AVEN_158425-1 [Araneus ventricosus]
MDLTTTSTWMRSRRISKRTLASSQGIAMRVESPSSYSTALFAGAVRSLTGDGHYGLGTPATAAAVIQMTRMLQQGVMIQFSGIEGFNPLGTFDECDSSSAYLGEVTVDE